MTMVSNIKIRDMVLTALFAAVLCVIAPFTIPIGPIPLSLATFAVYLAPSVLGWRRGTAAVLVYLLLGLVGLPVFSGFTGGFQKIAGMTGGYLVGYLPCAFLTGCITSALGKKVWANANILAMVTGTLVLYALGTAWFMAVTGSTLENSLVLCVIPFLPGDATKMVLVAVIAPPLRTAVDAYAR